jgi:uncharacterized repeat protein (TIGR01451 family)
MKMFLVTAVLTALGKLRELKSAVLWLCVATSSLAFTPIIYAAKAALPNQEITLQVAKDGDGSSPFAPNTGAVTQTAGSGCVGDVPVATGPSGWGAHSAGADTDANNCVVRTNDTVVYRVDWNNNERPTKALTITLNVPATISTGYWKPLPSGTIAPGCKAGSAITNNGKTFTCIVGDLPEGSSGAIFPTMFVGAQLDGDKLLMTAKLTSTEKPAGATSNPTTISISGKPAWDWVKGTPESRIAQRAGVDGRYYKFPLWLQPSGAGGKGSEPMNDATPINFVDHLYDISPNAVFTGCGPWDSTFGSIQTQVANGVAPNVKLSTYGSLPYGSASVAGATATNAVAGAPIYTCALNSASTATNGYPTVNINVAGQNTKTAPAKNNDGSNNGSGVVAAMFVEVWVPEADLTAKTGYISCTSPGTPAFLRNAISKDAAKITAPGASQFATVNPILVFGTTASVDETALLDNSIFDPIKVGFSCPISGGGGGATPPRTWFHHGVRLVQGPYSQTQYTDDKGYKWKAQSPVNYYGSSRTFENPGGWQGFGFDSNEAIGWQGTNNTARANIMSAELGVSTRAVNGTYASPVHGCMNIDTRWAQVTKLPAAISVREVAIGSMSDNRGAQIGGSTAVPTEINTAGFALSHVVAGDSSSIPRAVMANNTRFFAVRERNIPAYKVQYAKRAVPIVDSVGANDATCNDADANGIGWVDARTGNLGPFLDSTTGNYDIQMVRVVLGGNPSWSSDLASDFYPGTIENGVAFSLHVDLQVKPNDQALPVGAPNTSVGYVHGSRGHGAFAGSPSAKQASGASSQTTIGLASSETTPVNGYNRTEPGFCGGVIPDNFDNYSKGGVFHWSFSYATPQNAQGLLFDKLTSTGWCNTSYNKANETDLDGTGNRFGPFDPAGRDVSQEITFYNDNLAIFEASHDRFEVRGPSPFIGKSNVKGLGDIVEGNGSLVTFDIPFGITGANVDQMNSVTVSDPLPSYYKFISLDIAPSTTANSCAAPAPATGLTPGAGTCVLPAVGVAGGAITCNFGSRCAGWSDKIRITVQVTGAQALQALGNQAYISGIPQGSNVVQQASAPAYAYMPPEQRELRISKGVKPTVAPQVGGCSRSPSYIDTTLVPAGFDQELLSVAEWQTRCGSIPLNDNMKFQLRLENSGNSALLNPVVIDVLPHNADGSEAQTAYQISSTTTQQIGFSGTPAGPAGTLGDGRSPRSRFAGTLAVTAFTNVAGTATNGLTTATAKLYCTSDAASTIARDPYDPANTALANAPAINSTTTGTPLAATRWTLATGTTCPAGSTAFAFVLDNPLPAGKTVEYEVTLDSQSNVADNLYTNAFGARTASMTVPTRSNDVSIMTFAYSVGNIVWLDSNRNGVQDPGEPGVNGAVVNLLDSAGAQLYSDPVTGAVSTNNTGTKLTVTTGPSGTYLFENLPPADYRVEFIQPFGYKFTTADAAAAGDLKDSDATAANATTGGRYVPVTLGPTAPNMGVADGGNQGDPAVPGRNPTIDVGFFVPMSLGNRVWFDANNNGIMDAGEIGISGVNVVLYKDANNDGVPDGPAIANTTTDTNGYYLFDNLDPGTYIVGVDPASPGLGGATSKYVSSTGGNSLTTGIYEGSAVPSPNTDIDKDDNGSKDNSTGNAWSGFVLSKTVALVIGAEPVTGIGATNETDPLPGTITNTATDANSNLTVDFGFYLPYDLKITKAITSSGPYTPGASSVTYTLKAENLGPGTASAGISVKDKLPTGLTATAASGTDWTCAPPTGAAVEITCNRATTATPLAAGAQAALITVTATVDANASGSLTNVAQVIPALADVNKPELIPLGGNGGYEDGANTGTGTGANPSNNDDGKSIVVTAPLYSIGDLVWIDANNNGKIDGAEAPLAGAKVELFASDSLGNPTGAAIGSITTDTTGRYRFDALAAGSYVVVVTPPAGYASSTGTAITGGAVVSDELDNGKDVKIAVGAGAGGFPSSKITLGSTTPSAEKNNAAVVPGAQVSGAGGESIDARSDRTVDFGFYLPYDLKITKSITSSGPYTPGASSVTYTLKAENLGPGGANAGITVKDKLPVGLTATAASGTDWTCTPTTGAAVEITCNRTATATPLAAGAQAALITVTATVDANAGGSLLNVAQVIPALADANKPELIPLGGNGGYEDGSNTGTGTGANPSNNDDSKSITVGAAIFSIGDLVWVDANNNGKIDGAEVPLAGAKVELFASDAAGNPTGAAIGSITTDATGRYRFDALAAGSYVVVVTPPAGYASSTGTAVTGGSVSADELDNGKDVKIAGGAGAGGFPSGKITLGSTIPSAEKNNTAVVPGAQISGAGGESIDARSDRTVDFGFYLPFDLTIAKAITSAGPYLPGNTVTYALTAKNLGPGVALGNIVVKDKLPAGLTAVSAAGGSEWSCTPQTGAGVEIICNRIGADLAANASTPVITVSATIDTNATGSLLNAAQVNPDARTPASTPELIPLGTTNGGYENGNPTPQPGSNPSNNDDSKSILVSGLPYSLGNRVWVDANNNGAVDAGESGLDGVTVRLLDVLGVPVPGIPTLTTTNGGYYLFTDIPAGNYIVEIVTPVAASGVSYTSSTGSNGNVNGPYEPTGGTSFANIATNYDHGRQFATNTIRSGVVTLGPSQPLGEDGNATPGYTDANPDGRSNLTVDFGVFLPAKLGNLTWIDTNNNGKADSDEPGVNGIVVILRDAAGGEIARQTTRDRPSGETSGQAGPGWYQFTNLVPGQYRVEFQASGYVSSSAGAPATTTGSPPETSNNQLPAGVSSGQTALVTLATGDNNPQLDAGFVHVTTVAQPVPTLDRWAQFLLISILLIGTLRSRKRARIEK